jgi:uncharacterized protein (TIGR02118 family)
VRQLRRREVAKIVGTPDGGPAPYYMMAEYYFDSMDDLQTAFTSEAGQRLNEDLANFAEAGFSIFVSQISNSESRPIHPSA